MLHAILLAAGESSRMGKDNKLLMPWQGRPLIAHMAAMLQQTAAVQLLVVLGHEAEAVRAVLPPDTASVINPHWAEGMTTTIAAGIQAASPAASGYIICLADQPLLQSADMDELAAQFQRGLVLNPRAIGVPFYGEQRGNPVFFAAAWREDLLAQKGKGGCRALVKANAHQVLRLQAANDHILHDMDTPEARSVLLRRRKDVFSDPAF